MSFMTYLPHTLMFMTLYSRPPPLYFVRFLFSVFVVITVLNIKYTLDMTPVQQEAFSNQF